MKQLIIQPPPLHCFEEVTSVLLRSGQARTVLSLLPFPLWLFLHPSDGMPLPASAIQAHLSPHPAEFLPLFRTVQPVLLCQHQKFRAASYLPAIRLPESEKDLSLQVLTFSRSHSLSEDAHLPLFLSFYSHYRVFLMLFQVILRICFTLFMGKQLFFFRKYVIKVFLYIYAFVSL